MKKKEKDAVAASLDIFATGGGSPWSVPAPQGERMGPASAEGEGPIGADLFVTGGGMPPSVSTAPLSTEAQSQSPLVLAGRYQLEGELGHGGMGRVYLAKDLQKDRLIAIKTLEVQLLDAGWQEQWLQELQVHARLKHPYIAPMYDLVRDDAVGFFLTMEFVEGADVERFWLAGKANEHPNTFSLATTQKLLSQLAEALDHAHKQGVLHLDIKPSNVLLQRPSCSPLELDARQAKSFNFEAVKLIDFGIAKLRARDTSGQVLGTVYYMAPEQLRGVGPLTPATDVYALGILTYQLLTGEMYQGGMPGPSVLNEALSPAVDAVFEKAIAYQPAERFQTAGAFVEALSQVLHPIEKEPIVLGKGGRLTVQKPRSRVVERVVVKEVLAEPTGSEQRWPQIKARIEDKRPSWLETPFMRKAPKTLPVSALPKGALEGWPVAPLAESLILLDRNDRPLLELCPVPKGTFLMGADAKDRTARRSEKPQQKVQMSGFYLARTPVTNDIWKTFLEESRYQQPKAHAHPDYLQGWAGVPLCYPNGQHDFPVSGVSYLDAWAFCDFYGLSLPSEAQWEYAMRGGDGRPFPWGDALPDPKAPESMVAQIGQPEQRACPVGMRPKGASPFGLFDAIGPVQQWAADEYDARWLRQVGRKGSDPILRGSRLEGFYSIRGAHAMTAPDQAQVYRRHSAPPHTCQRSLGFRPCLDLERVMR